MLLSSANKIGFDGSAIHKIIYANYKENKGPSIEPWGTPWFILKKMVILEKQVFTNALW
jgi:hypothetical protein